MAVVNRSTSIEFVVKPKHDLYLDGPLKKIPRVTKGDSYPCQMQKNQSFNCLFRHYAKHNGLRKEDLVFSFVDALLPDQTPETVHLMPHDEITVEHVSEKIEKAEVDPIQLEQNFSAQFKKLLTNPNHSDVTFCVGENQVEIRAHKAILTARSEYFEAMFREGSMCESLEGYIKTERDVPTFRRMLEFIYSNTVADMEEFSSDEIISLLVMANEYLLKDLRKICENHAAKIISTENVGKLLLLSAGHNASVLRLACSTFVNENREFLASNDKFRQEIEENPELGILLFESSLKNSKLPRDIEEYEDERSNKRRRISEPNNEAEGSEPTELLGLGLNDVGINSNTIAQNNQN